MSRNFICQRPLNSIVFGTHGISSCYCYYGPTLPLDELYKREDLFYHPKLIELRTRITQSRYDLCDSNCLIIKKGKEHMIGQNTKMLINYDGLVAPFKNAPPQLQEITMAIEDGCNLSCPSCRTKVRGNSLSREIIESSWNYLYTKLSTIKVVSLGGSGEPLTHEHVLSFLKNTTKTDAPKLEMVSIITNGTLLNENLWKSIAPFVREKLKIEISIDGATQKTFEENRRGANFKDVISNLRYISAQKHQGITLLCVLQKNNFREIPLFIELTKELGINLNFYAIRNWGTFTKNQFDQINIFRPNHPDHQELLEQLKLTKDCNNVRLEF